MSEKTDREWAEFCRPYVYMNGSHEMPNYAAICKAVLALTSAPAALPDSVLTEEDLEDLVNSYGFGGDFEEMAHVVETMVLCKLKNEPFFVPSPAQTPQAAGAIDAREQEAMRMLWDDQQPEEKAHYLSVVSRGQALALHKPASEIDRRDPLFWYRPCGDNLYEGPHHTNSADGKILRSEKPDEWKPLYTAAALASRPEAPPAAGAAQTMTRAEVDRIVYACRQAGDDSTYAIVNAAIAATPAPEVGEVMLRKSVEARLFNEANEMLFDVWKLSLRAALKAALPGERKEK